LPAMSEATARLSAGAVIRAADGLSTYNGRLTAASRADKPRILIATSQYLPRPVGFWRCCCCVAIA
jgi:hypothetical protein